MASTRLITFHYKLKDAMGNVIDTSYNGRPITFLEGQQHLISGLERALQKLKPGDRRRVHVPAAEAYGIYDETLVLSLPRKELDEDNDLALGRTFRIGLQGESSRLFSVVSMTESNVTLDGNHPLAGKDLIFDVELLNIQSPTDRDTKGGFVPGPGQFLH